MTFVANAVHLKIISDSTVSPRYSDALGDVVGYAVTAVSKAVILVQVGFVSYLYRLQGNTRVRHCRRGERRADRHRL